MKPEDELMLRALDRDLGAEAEAGLDAEELRRLRRIAAGLRGLETVPAPPGFTERVMAALPERPHSVWVRLRDLFVRPHVIRLNLAWETGVATALLLLALSTYSWGPNPWPNSWGPTPAATPPQTSPLVHTRFIVKAPEARAVTLAGDFNSWRQDDVRLVKAETEGVWSVTVPLAPGRYKYMFIVDGKQWQTDPLAEAYEHDGFGHQNAVVEIASPEQA